MAKTKRWETLDLQDGVITISFSSWKYFPVYISDKFANYKDYIFRGQRSENWALSPTLDRILDKSWRLNVRETIEEHLGRFIFATRGRRGSNPPNIDKDNEGWALGQHHGLATPLLDWTRSPFVAAYFAFIGDGPDNTDRRVVYALSVIAIEEKSDSIINNHSGQSHPPIIEIINPLSDENPRLVNQDGLFTRAPDFTDIESWVRHNFKGTRKRAVLIKFTIPNKDRAMCLRNLNRMNINHLTLFPDLYGASKYCNLDLEIENY